MTFQTIFHNRYSPKNEDLIYHYCSTEVFLSICNTKTLWLSDIYKMNDSSEFNWGRNKVIDIINKYQTEFSPEFRETIITNVFLPNFHLHPVTCSFSKTGDLLSQWRAYANDGKGFSIGFSAKNIHERLGVNINSVIYSETEQDEIIANTIRGLFIVFQNKDKDFMDMTMGFCFDLVYLKNPTFFEEQEIRIVRLLRKTGNSIKDPGGNSKFGKVPILPILNRQGKTDQIMYITLPFSPNEDLFIKEIIIGPKNNATIESVVSQLNNLSLPNVKIKKSVSTYQ